jgi:hypothetical protein
MTEAAFLEPFYSVTEDGGVAVSAEQGSRFAKEVAGDYNYIHDPESKRFCVPGDLLAALVLAHFGLSEHMAFSFRGMVAADTPLYFPERAASAFDVTDADGKVYMHVERSGASQRDAQAVAAFLRQYVALSGQTFPHYLKPLMAEHGVMFNPERPLVIYDRMAFDLERLDFGEPELAFAGGSLDASAKRADVAVRFAIHAGRDAVGTAAKHLVISGLRPYDEARMNELIASFHARKARLEAARSAR